MGDLPTRKGARVLRLRPTGGVYCDAIGGSTKGSGKRAEAQRAVSRGLARSVGWRPGPEIKYSVLNAPVGSRPSSAIKMVCEQPELIKICFLCMNSINHIAHDDIPDFFVRSSRLIC